MRRFEYFVLSAPGRGLPQADAPPKKRKPVVCAGISRPNEGEGFVTRLQNGLDHLGNKGWEMCGTVSNCVVFKRELPPKPAHGGPRGGAAFTDAATAYTRLRAVLGFSHDRRRR